jgi:23S rRNA pseudouridine2604 synthase
MGELVRLSKCLVELIQCSRSEAERYIEGGWVLVDGEVIDRPQFKVQNQKVELHADATLEPIALMTILLNLPEGFDEDDPAAGLQLIIPETRAENDSSGIRTLKRHFARLMPTAPLEAGATGLLVFSQDERVVKRLVKDANKNEQEYVVEVSGEIAPHGIEKLNRSMKINGWPLPVAKVSWQNENRLRFALKNVRPGQIEFMCKSVELTVVAMMRIRIGRVPMAKLQPGQWRYLPVGNLF